MLNVASRDNAGVPDVAGIHHIEWKDYSELAPSVTAAVIGV